MDDMKTFADKGPREPLFAWSYRLIKDQESANYIKKELKNLSIKV